jgi:hypothetical protein
MLYSEIIADCSQIHTKHINTLCGQNLGFLNDKSGGIITNHWSLNGWTTPVREVCNQKCGFSHIHMQHTYQQFKHISTRRF